MALKYEWMTVGHAVVIYLAMLAPPAESKDFGILTRMLYAAFLAEQGMAICTAGDPAFASETGGPNGDMHTYVQHIKAEVTAGLSETVIDTHDNHHDQIDRLLDRAKKD